MQRKISEHARETHCCVLLEPSAGNQLCEQTAKYYKHKKNLALTNLVPETEYITVLGVKLSITLHHIISGNIRTSNITYYIKIHYLSLHYAQCLIRLRNHFDSDVWSVFSTKFCKR